MAMNSAGSGGLNLGPGGESGRSKELLWVGILAAVIIVGVCVTIFSTWSDDETPKEKGVKAMAQCINPKCKATFEIDPYAEQSDAGNVGEGWHIALYSCPVCGGKHCALPMTQCPDTENCGKFFLADETVYQYEDELARRKGRKPRVRDIPRLICPHCGIDVRKFKQEQRKRNR